MQNFDRFEMVSPRVQIHGEVAVLMFNHTSEGFTGMWNCTEVYRRFPDSWKIIHNHWSDIHPKQ